MWAWSERTGVFGRTVTLKLRYADFRTLTRSQTARTPFGTRAALAGTTLALVRGLFPLENPVRLLGVTLSGFAEEARCLASHRQAAFDFADGAAAPGSTGRI